MTKLTTNIFICLLLTILSCNQSPRQEKITDITADTLTSTDNSLEKESFKQVVDSSPNELLEFLPTNYSILNATSGDLNLDGINDYILVLKKNDEDSLFFVSDGPEKRPLLILIRDKNNKLKLVRRNDNTVYCFGCGGIMGDPFMGITIKNGYFSVEHYGGSAWRWTRIITYKYSKKDNEWFLHKDGSESFYVFEPENVESKIKTTKDFGKVKFEEFDIYKEDE
ncbi:MAG: hypothetical protein GX259_07900 [Bacteroidales bacterium]|nr:hypothetical protein [Bacteroidales bacterium]